MSGCQPAESCSNHAILFLSMMHAMEFFAATGSPATMDRLREIPPEFWMKVAIGIVGVIAVVIFLRKIAKVNKVVLGVIVMLALSFTGFNWIYERNEPAWATPFVERVAHFFPSKGPIRHKELPK